MTPAFYDPWRISDALLQRELSDSQGEFANRALPAAFGRLLMPDLRWENPSVTYSL